MKLVVFAHTPPPHHGQSYMVELMMTGFGGDRRKKAAAGGSGTNNPFAIECYHVNSRLSQRLEDIGDLRVGKLVLLLGYCVQAIWCRFRYGVHTLYYIPAPGKRSALYRDWVVMWICRPFFKRVILHWHAAGLAKWLETSEQMPTRALTYRFLKQVDLSVVLSRYNCADAEKLLAREIKVVGNGIPDPCPEFAHEVLPRRKARFNARRRILAGEALSEADLRDSGPEPQVIRVLYLAHCTRSKGLFDTVTGVVMANERLLAERAPLSLRLCVAGNFLNAQESAEFERLVTSLGQSHCIEYLGFVTGQRKNQLLREADLFCFPTFYQNENQPVNLLEAMAFGLPILTTRWRSIPELLPENYAGLVNINSPAEVCAALLKLPLVENGEGFRQIFLQNFTLARYLAGLAEAFYSVDEPKPIKAASGVPVMPTT